MFELISFMAQAVVVIVGFIIILVFVLGMLKIVDIDFEIKLTDRSKKDND